MQFIEQIMLEARSKIETVQQLDKYLNEYRVSAQDRHKIVTVSCNGHCRGLEVTFDQNKVRQLGPEEIKRAIDEASKHASDQALRYQEEMRQQLLNEVLETNESDNRLSPS